MGKFLFSSIQLRVSWKLKDFAVVKFFLSFAVKIFTKGCIVFIFTRHFIVQSQQ